MDPRFTSAILWTLICVNVVTLIVGGLITWLGYAIPVRYCFAKQVPVASRLRLSPELWRLKQFGLLPELAIIAGFASLLVACLGLCALNYSSYHAMNIYGVSCAIFVLILVLGLPDNWYKSSQFHSGDIGVGIVYYALLIILIVLLVSSFTFARHLHSLTLVSSETSDSPLNCTFTLDPQASGDQFPAALTSNHSDDQHRQQQQQFFKLRAFPNQIGQLPRRHDHDKLNSSERLTCSSDIQIDGMSTLVLQDEMQSNYEALTRQTHLKCHIRPQLQQSHGCSSTKSIFASRNSKYYPNAMSNQLKQYLPLTHKGFYRINSQLRGDGCDKSGWEARHSFGIDTHLVHAGIANEVENETGGQLDDAAHGAINCSYDLLRSQSNQSIRASQTQVSHLDSSESRPSSNRMTIMTTATAMRAPSVGHNHMATPLSPTSLIRLEERNTSCPEDRQQQRHRPKSLTVGRCRCNLIASAASLAAKLDSSPLVTPGSAHGSINTRNCAAAFSPSSHHPNRLTSRMYQTMPRIESYSSCAINSNTDTDYLAPRAASSFGTNSSTGLAKKNKQSSSPVVTIATPAALLCGAPDPISPGDHNMDGGGGNGLAMDESILIDNSQSNFDNNGQELDVTKLTVPHSDPINFSIMYRKPIPDFGPSLKLRK